MSERHRGGLTAATLATLLLATPALASPLTGDIQPPLPAGSIAVVERGRLEVATGGPAPEGADETTLSLTTMAAAAPHRRLTLSATFDLMWRSAELSAPGGDRVERTASGAGDLTLLAASPLALAEGLVAAPFAGVKLPTGTDDQVDRFGRLPQRLQVGTGAFDLPAGVFASWARDRLALFSAATYTLRTEANDFDAGDSLRWDLAAQHSITAGPIAFDAALEGHLLWRAADRGRRAPAESGGASVYVAPGLRARFDRHALEAAVEIPLAQPFDQHVDYMIHAGYRLMVR